MSRSGEEAVRHYAPWLAAAANDTLAWCPRLAPGVAFEQVGSSPAWFARTDERHWIEVDPLLPRLVAVLEAGRTPLGALFDAAVSLAPERALDLEWALWTSLQKLARAGLVSAPPQAA